MLCFVCIVTRGAVGAHVCRWCMFLSCVHPVAGLYSAFSMTCSLLMACWSMMRGDHMEEAYSRAGLVTALLCTSYCLPHPVLVSVLSFVVGCMLVLRCCECVCCM